LIGLNDFESKFPKREEIGENGEISIVTHIEATENDEISRIKHP
jgi:hypothetical protein